MNNPLFNQLNKENNIKGSDSQIFYNQTQINNDKNQQLKSPVSDSLLYNNMQPASDLFSNSTKEPEFSISSDNTNENQSLLNSFQADFRPNVASPLSQNVLNSNQQSQQNQILSQTTNNQNLQSSSINSTLIQNQMNTGINQENIFDNLAYNTTNNMNTNNNWPDYLTNQHQSQNQQPSIANYNAVNNIPNIMDSYNNYDYNKNGNIMTNNNQMTNTNFPNFYSKINTNQNQNIFSPTPQNQMNLLQNYGQSQNNTYNQNQIPMNDPLQMNMQNVNQPLEQQNSMNYKQNTNYNANFADPEMFKSLPSLNQYNTNTTNVNNTNTANTILQNSMNDPLNVNLISTSTPPPPNNIINNNSNMNNIQNNNNNQINNNVKQENRISNNLYNKNVNNSSILQSNLERTNSNLMERSSSNQGENPLSIKTSSFQTVNSIEFNSPGINSVISIDTDKASLLTPFPDIQPSSITWEKLFSSLELPPSFLNCQTPSLPESSKISLDNWVDPDIFFLIPNSDSLIDYLRKHFPKDTVFNRGLPKAEENDKYPEGTSILITSQSWHALAVLTKKQILSTSPTKVDTLMRLWYCHILALSKLGLIQIARAEIQKLGDFENDPKYQFESYPDFFPGLYGTFVSFEIRVLKVLLLSYLDDTKQSLNGIYTLLHETKKQIARLERNIGNNISLQDGNNVNVLWLRTWKSREIQLQLIIASLLIKMKNVPSAIKVLKKIQKRYPKHPEILSAIGRLHIQIGNHDEAKKYFRQVENLIKDLKKSISNYNQQNTPLSLNTNTINVKQLHEIILMNRSYISIMDNLYDLATQSLLEVLALNPTHLVAANNLALCYLYQGQLKKAIEAMENMISAGPALACSQESFIFNLSTMYDLTSNTFLHKKKFCLDRIVKYSKDGLAVSCLKLN